MDSKSIYYFWEILLNAFILGWNWVKKVLQNKRLWFIRSNFLLLITLIEKVDRGKSHHTSGSELKIWSQDWCWLFLRKDSPALGMWIPNSCAPEYLKLATFSFVALCCSFCSIYKPFVINFWKNVQVCCFPMNHLLVSQVMQSLGTALV